MNTLSTYANSLAQGTALTLGLSLCALLFGFALTIVLYAAQSSHYKILNVITKSISSLIRGFPELLVLFFIYFGAEKGLSVFQHPVNVSEFATGVFALGLIFAAYGTQILKGAFQAIPKGQTENAQALGLSKAYIFYHILLPQAWRHAIPGLGNQTITLLKDSSLVSLIGLSELMTNASFAASNTFQYLKFYVTAALIYLALTLLFQSLLNQWHKHSKRYLCETLS